jgi:hypothetical protein
MTQLVPTWGAEPLKVVMDFVQHADGSCHVHVCGIFPDGQEPPPHGPGVVRTVAWPPHVREAVDVPVFRVRAPG